MPRLLSMDRERIDAFVAERRLAIVGVSRSGRGFGAIALRELRKRGYELLPVHPEVDELAGQPAYRALDALPAPPVGGVLAIVPPEQAAQVARAAAAAGLRRLWLQQGAESEAVVALCDELDLQAVWGRCILMFAEPVRFPHALHRWFARRGKRFPRPRPAPPDGAAAAGAGSDGAP